MAAEMGLPRFAAKQMAQWLYQKHVTHIDDMTNLSKSARERLKENYEIGTAEPLQTLISSDGTEKYLFPTDNGHHVETVFIPDGERRTLCVSTQVGCKMNCLFCQTGKQGFQGNLTVTDILRQVIWAHRRYALTNLVLMGQGEPLDNYDAMMQALQLITSDEGMGWSPRRITVSTVGLRKTLQRFLDESPCNLAVSLHSPIHSQRLQIMPAEKQFPIADIVTLLAKYFPRNQRLETATGADSSHQRRLSFEYIVMHGINDTPAHMKELIRLLRPLNCRVNLIRWHEIPGVDLQSADEATMLQLRNWLTQHGVFTTIRASRGQDIFAACGLLSTGATSRHCEEDLNHE